MTDQKLEQAIATAIQKVATGPEYSKDLSHEEAYEAARYVLSGQVDPVRAGVLLIALRMKRETNEEYCGFLQAIREATNEVTANVPEVLDVCDPYDGFLRGVPVSPFLPAVMAACGVPTVSHGLESTGPKFGATHFKVLKAAGKSVELSPEEVAARLEQPEIGWGYVDQSRFCPDLYGLLELRRRIIKRPIITTIETLVGPIRGLNKTHMMAGYVHKAYPPIYTHLARFSGFTSAAIVRGVEGGMTASLKQEARFFYYRENEAVDQMMELDPTAIGISQETRAIPVPSSLINDADETVDIEGVCRLAVDLGMAALKGEAGAARDSLTYAGAIALLNMGKVHDLAGGAAIIREKLDNGEALARFEQG